MTEVRPDPNEELFRSLKSIHMDPILTTVFDEMKSRMEFLKNTPLTGGQITMLMNEIDAKWRNAMYRKGRFSGIAKFPDPTQPDAPPVEKFYEDQAIVFRGAFPTEIADGTVETHESEETKFYDLRVQLALLAKDDDGKDLEFIGTTTIDGIEKLDIDGLMSFDRAVHTLEHFVPELYSILEDLFTAEGIHECEIALRLQGLSYSGVEEDTETRNQILLALDTYSNNMLKFDGIYGYVLGVDGAGWMMSDEGLPARYKMDVKALAKVHAFDWRLAADGDDRVLPHLVASIGREKLGEQTNITMIPLEAVHTFRSQRYTFYKD